MAGRLTTFGNELYTGERSFNFVGKRRTWYPIIGILLLLSVLVPVLRGGVNLGIEFTGGSQFLITGVTQPTQQPAINAVHTVEPEAVVRVSTVGGTGIRVQTDQLTQEQSRTVVGELAAVYEVPATDVTSSFIGPVWGADITRQTLQGLIVFLLLAAVGMTLYFRTWKMSVAAIVALLVDLVITSGVYAATGFEITPAAIIGILTILAYSLYDTVVVFDKIRENTAELAPGSTRSFPGAVNLAVNQTLVRSINTSVVAALPVAAILVIGAFVLGADTLRDISLALFIGILVGTWSTVFLAAPLYSQLRENEPRWARGQQGDTASEE